MSVGDALPDRLLEASRTRLVRMLVEAFQPRIARPQPAPATRARTTAAAETLTRTPDQPSRAGRDGVADYLRQTLAPGQRCSVIPRMLPRQEPRRHRKSRPGPEWPSNHDALVGATIFREMKVTLPQT